MPTCKLCHEEAELRRSHIYPDHLYGLARDDDNVSHFIRAQGNIQRRQQGLWEYLFCDECEQLLSREYENYFADLWLNNNALPNSIASNTYTIENIDYLKFKLYHLSILFRTSISSLPEFTGIHLGPHEETIRQMLLSQDDNDNYQIAASVLIHEDRTVEKRIITFPKWVSHNAHTFYQTIFSGCAWLIKVSSHNHAEMSEISLQEDGTISMECERWETYSEIQLLRQIYLNREAR